MNTPSFPYLYCYKVRKKRQISISQSPLDSNCFGTKLTESSTWGLNVTHLLFTRECVFHVRGPLVSTAYHPCVLSGSVFFSFFLFLILHIYYDMNMHVCLMVSFPWFMNITMKFTKLLYTI